MQQDSNQQREQPHILDQVVVPALPPEFQHADIGRQYQDGEFTSRLDAEIEDILRGYQPAGEPGETALITLSGDAASALEDLHCIALIQGDQVLPLLDIEQVTAPLTTAQKHVSITPRHGLCSRPSRPSMKIKRSVRSARMMIMRRMAALSEKTIPGKKMGNVLVGANLERSIWNARAHALRIEQLKAMGRVPERAEETPGEPQ